MITLRHGPRLEDRFTMISNDVFQRADLSFRAKAIYGYLMSCRSGWQLTRDRIAEALEVSAGTIRRALEELEDAGYLVRSQSKGPDGRFNVVEYTIFSEPAPGSRAPRKAGKPADTVCTNMTTGAEQRKQGESAGGTVCTNMTTGAEQRKQGESAGGTVCTNLSNGDDQQKHSVSAGQTECTNLTPLIRTIKTKKKSPETPYGCFCPQGGRRANGGAGYHRAGCTCEGCASIESRMLPPRWVGA
ncbi:helix-turn-helix domain-containing protein [Corynebacterium diphtheriae]|uniref:helix-turn-helix domain-containing protein n=1 Tax=Corynebacterium diphtheriae TaxID=1717 RepID=UPI00217D9E19|nr:helix-turn-helix domain-containing protein [Corynebacterium diphtheriae]